MNEFSISCLCNLSLGKGAWQSSEYGIAGDNATNVLNDDGRRDFGFHTKVEDNPWWEIDLKDVYKISHIKVANRRKHCQEKAGTLTVEISESGEDNDWRTVHTGIMHWDGDVTFFLAGRAKARWVRLSLKEHNAFHLANVEIWGCAPRVKQITPPAPERFCLYDAPGLGGMDEISKSALVTKNDNALTFDFRDIYPIEAVVLEKPLSAGWDGAESLRMETSRDGRSWQLVHEGLMFWAAKMYYPLRGEVIGRFLRLSPNPALSGKKGGLRSFFASAKGLGFEKARIFTKRADMTIHCAKPDGFGARLIALLYAVYLSKVLNVRMTFAWPEWSEWPDYKPDSPDRPLMGMQLPPPDKIFSEDFIQKHFLPDGPVSYDAAMAGKADMFRRHFLDTRNHDKGKMMFSRYHNSNNMLNGSLKDGPGFDYRDAFQLIGFSPEMSAMIEAAQKADVAPGFTALHMRTGDLIYSRQWGHYGMRLPQKITVPLPLARLVLETLEQEGCPAVLIFGEDTAAMRLLADDFKNVRLALDMAPTDSLGIPERNLFEIVLMSRARVICAPTKSAFSNLPEIIAEKKPEMRFIHDMFAPEEMVARIEEDLCKNMHRYPPPHSAYSYKLLYWTELDCNRANNLLRFVEKAAACDPENPVYGFFRAIEHCREGEFQKSEEVLSEVCGQWPEEKQWRHSLPEDRYLHPLRKAAELGNRFACRVMGAAAARRGEHDEARRLREEGSSGCLKNLAPAGQARQSSDYDWGGRGRTDAANAFNDDGRRDFGFHTKEEENPWWEVSLKELSILHYIILVNRRNTCQEKIMTLTAEISAEEAGDEWTGIHTGIISWDGTLVLPLDGRVTARRVRLSLREKRMFHLAAVEVWGAPLSARPETSVAPEKFHLYDREPESDLEGSLKAPPAAAPGILTAELAAAAPLDALIISKSGAENWPDLKIETSRDGRNWLTVHEGLMYWSGRMHYPLQGEIFTRFVRLSSKLEAEKGEKAAPVDVKIFTTKEKPGLYVIHRQMDGLGGRMLSLLHAMYLADVLNVPMRMAWSALDRPSFECEGVNVQGVEVAAAKDVFDEEFLAAHLRSDLPLAFGTKLLDKRGLTRRNLLSQEMMDKPGFLCSMHVLELGSLLSGGLAPSGKWELHRYFKKIGFAPELLAMIEAAEKIDVAGGLAAIHLRAGDLVYHSNYSTTFEDCLFNFDIKGLPIQLARMSIERALESGVKNVIIFSDDVAVSQVLADDYNISYARRFWPAGELTNTQISLFEAVLMSRASVLYRASTSAFSRFAQAISEGIEAIDVHKFFKYEDIFPYVQADLKKNAARYSAPQNAYSYGYLYYTSRGRQETDFLLETLASAASFTPENVTFKVYKALELFRVRRDIEGEAALKEVFTLNRRAKTFDLINKSSMAFRNVDFVKWRNAVLRPVFEEAAKRGNPFACHMTSLIYSCHGKPAEAASWHEAAIRAIS